MNICLIIGRKNSKRLKNKNTRVFLGKPIYEYPLKTALDSKVFTQIFFSTDINSIQKRFKNSKKIKVVNRPQNLAKDAPGVLDVVKNFIKKNLNYKNNNKKLKINLFCVFATSVFLTKNIIKKTILLNKKNSKNFVITVTNYNHPIERSFKIRNSKLSLNYKNNKIDIFDKIFIGERIRDMKYIDDLNLILLFLENSASLGILRLSN